MNAPLVGITVRGHAADPKRRTPYGYYIPAAHVQAVEAAGFAGGLGTNRRACSSID